MKKFLLTFSVLFLFEFSWSKPTIPLDSLEKRLSILEMELKGVKNESKNLDEDALINKIKENVSPKITKNKETQIKSIRQLSILHKILILSPLLAVLIIMLLLFIFLKQAKFSLNEALSYKHIDPDNEGEIIYYPSASKLFAFITIVLGGILVSLIFTFQLYFTFKRLPIPNFLGLWPITVFLFTGILPYVFQTIFKKTDENYWQYKLTELKYQYGNDADDADDADDDDDDDDDYNDDEEISYDL